jgi:hypothetical protein
MALKEFDCIFCHGVPLGANIDDTYEKDTSPKNERITKTIQTRLLNI